MKKWKRKFTKLILDSPHFKVRRDVVELPNKKTKEWTYWDSEDSAMVVAMTKKKKLVMIRQFRYLVNDVVIEFPSGGLHEGEEIKEGAKREFEEETGFKCGSLTPLVSVYETYGSLNRKIHIFFTKGVELSEQDLDRGEQGFEEIEIVLEDFEKVVNLALENKIAAMGSTLAILCLKEKIERGEIVI